MINSIALTIRSAIMFKVELDEIRENRIANEAVVDAYEEEEIAMGWYYYLQDRLVFPFQARWGSRKSSDRTVTVLEMSTEDDCLNDMYVEVLYKEANLEDVFSARLSEIHPVDADLATIEAIADWHYWVKRGYQF